MNHPTAAAALEALTARMPTADADVAAAVRARWDALAKPPGSLGRLEDVAVRVAAAMGTATPAVPRRPVLLVCAADHGVHGRGVTPWPQAITTAMAGTIADGRAVSSAFARVVGAEVTVLDVGCAHPPAARPRLRSARVRAGTADLAVGPAMTAVEAVTAVVAGIDAVDALLDGGADLVALGDMGIGNTTASAALVAALTGRPAAAVTGPGAGADAAAMATKVQVVADAVRRLRDDAAPLEVLAEVGGLEHAALVGAILAAAARKVPIVLDGLITVAGALVAAAIAPAAVDHMIAGHRSPEPGATAALTHLGLHPLVDLDLRLGEGTGAVLAIPLIRAALAALDETATIAELAPPA